MREKSTLQIFMKKNKKNILKSLIPLFLMTMPVIVLGQVEVPNPIGYDTFGELMHAIVSFIRNVALMIAPIIFIIAGLMYYFAGGDPEKAKKATDTIKWTLVGLVIILIANGITAVITDIMGVEGP